MPRQLGPAALLACLCVTPLVPAAEPLSLFNGRDLDGWVAEGVKEFKDGDTTKPVWTVKDGLLCCNGKGFGFLRYDKREFADFAWHLEYRMHAQKPVCNSGLGIRTVPFDPKRSRETRPSYACYEIQLLDDVGKPPNEHSSGSLYRYVAPKANPVKPAGEWNTLDIECVGPRIRLKINDVDVLDVDQTTVDKIKDKPLKGYVCLQNHGGRIDFRNLRIREIKAADK